MAVGSTLRDDVKAANERRPLFTVRRGDGEANMLDVGNER